MLAIFFTQCMTSTGNYLFLFSDFQFVTLSHLYNSSYVFWFIFRSTENDHVKSNLPAKLFRIRSFGMMKLEEFKDLLSPEEYDACLKNKPPNSSWFPLTTKVFIAFLYRVSPTSSLYLLLIIVKSWNFLRLNYLSTAGTRCGLQ